MKPHHMGRRLAILTACMMAWAAAWAGSGGCTGNSGEPSDDPNPPQADPGTNTNDNDTTPDNGNDNSNDNSNDNQADNGNDNNADPDQPSDDPGAPGLPMVWSHAFEASGLGALSSVWGSGPDDVFVVGGTMPPGQGEVYHWNGTAWRAMRIPEVGLLVWVFGFGPNDVTAVGLGGGVVHYDGMTWTRLDSGTTQALWGIWGPAPNDMWIVGGEVGEGEPLLLHFDGTIFTPVPAPQNDRGATALLKVWGIGSKVFAVGDNGLIIQYEGGEWFQVPAGSNADDDFVSLWGTSEDHIVAVGGRPAARIAVYDGANWTTFKPPGIPGLNAVFMDAADEAILGGTGGFVARYNPFSNTIEKQAAPTTLDIHAAWGDGTGRYYAVGGRFTDPFVGLALVRTSGAPDIDPVPPLPPLVACVDEDDCAGGEVCEAGVCVQPACTSNSACGDDNVCTNDVCNADGSCSHANNTSACSDGVFCNGVDTCAGGLCIHAGDPCLGGGVCKNICNEAADTCFSAAGTACSNPADTDCDNPDSCDGLGNCMMNRASDGTPCTSDANDCTVDACTVGLCTHTNVQAGMPCGSAADTDCDNPNTCNSAGVCLPNNEPNATPCSADGVACTSDACSAGVCTHSGDSDGDGVCDAADQCPGFDDGEDADGDGIPNGCDVCKGGSALDLDGNGTVNASDLAILLGAWGPNPGHAADFNGSGVVNASDLALLLGGWGPVGSATDADGDGVQDACDVCPGGDDHLNTDGDAQPDFCDPCPTDNPDDPDGDNVCTSADSCPNGNNNIDGDGDAIPDACDACPNDNPNDLDGDGVCNSADICPGGNDGLDGDADGVPDFCDACPLDNPNDNDADGVCNSADLCPGFNDYIDTDGNGVPDGCCIVETDCVLGENCNGQFCIPAGVPDLEIGIGGGFQGCMTLPTWPYTKLLEGGLLRLCGGGQGFVELRLTLKVTGFAPNSLVLITHSLRLLDQPCPPTDCGLYQFCIQGYCSPIDDTTPLPLLLMAEGNGVNIAYLTDIMFFSPAELDGKDVILSVQVQEANNPAISAAQELHLTTFVKRCCDPDGSPACPADCPSGQECIADYCELE